MTKLKNFDDILQKIYIFAEISQQKLNTMRRNLLLIGAILCSYHCFSWDLSGIAGARGNAMGNCSVSLNDFWSIQNNPAGMADYRFLSLGLSYENRFFMKELSFYNTALVMPLQTGALGLSYSRFGFENFNENKLALAYARTFGSYLKMGLKLDYLVFDFSDEYAKRRTATFEFGVQSDITRDLRIGVYIFNPINVKLKTIYNERVPVIFRFGLSYNVTKDFLASSEVKYDTDRGLDLCFGLEYNTVRDFYIRVGAHTNPATASFGAGYTLTRVVVDVSATMNQHTGTSFQSSLIFKIK